MPPRRKAKVNFERTRVAKIVQKMRAKIEREEVAATLCDKITQLSTVSLQIDELVDQHTHTEEQRIEIGEFVIAQRAIQQEVTCLKGKVAKLDTIINE